MGAGVETQLPGKQRGNSQPYNMQVALFRVRGYPRRKRTSPTQQPEALHVLGEDVVHLASPENRRFSPVTVPKQLATAWLLILWGPLLISFLKILIEG